MKRTRTGVLAALGAVIVAVGGLTGVSPQATADTTTTAEEGPVGFVRGVVRFEAAASGAQVALYDPGAITPSRVIPLLIDKHCRVKNLDEVSELLDITVDNGSGAFSPGAVSLVDNGLGATVANGNCSRGNGRIDAGQAIRVEPGWALESDFLTASLNIEGKHGATLGWTAFLDAALVDSGSDPLVGQPDSGPDSGSADNTIVPIEPADESEQPVAFDALEITEASGGTNAVLSLDNGGDSSDGSPTDFLFGDQHEYAVNCTDENTVAATGTDDLDAVTFERLANGPNPEKDPTCLKIGVTVDILVDAATEDGAPRDVAFIDHTVTAADGTLQEVRALVTITWEVPRYNPDGSLRSAAEIDLELAREIVYDDGADAPRFDVEWCGAEQVVEEGFAPEPEHPEGHPWCLVSDERQIQGDVIVQTQIYHGMGDPRWI